MPSWEQLQPILNQLAEGLGTTAGNLWVVLVQRQIISGYQDLMWAAIWPFSYLVWFLVARAILASELTRRSKAEKRGDWWDGFDYRAWAFAFRWGGLAITILVVASILNEAIVHLASPEYSALQALLSMARK